MSRRSEEELRKAMKTKGKREERFLSMFSISASMHCKKKERIERKEEEEEYSLHIL